MKRWIAAGLAAVSCAAAHGQTAPELPALVEAAFNAGIEAPEDTQWRLTLTADLGERGGFVARYDGTQAEAERWTLIDPPSVDAMSDELRTAWVTMSTPDEDEDRSEDSDDGNSTSVGFSFGSGLFFGPESLNFVAGGIREIRSTPDQVVYAFDPNMAGEGTDDAVNRAMGENLVGELTISRDNPFVETLRIHAPDSFKPHIMARIHAFEIEMEFERQDEFPAPLLTRWLIHVEASALMQRMEQRMEFRFSDISFHTP